MTKQWQIVDRHGDVVVTAGTITAVAREQRRTPRQVAQRDARTMVNTEAGDEPVFAVAVTRCKCDPCQDGDRCDAHEG